MTLPVDSTARCFTPTSTPTTGPQRRAGTSVRSTSQPKLTNQRPACSAIVAEQIAGLAGGEQGAELRRRLGRPDLAEPRELDVAAVFHLDRPGREAPGTPSPARL